MKDMKISENLKANMCFKCCDKVEELILDIQQYSQIRGVTWNQEAWMRKLAKSYSQGIGLEYHSYRPINRLQRFLWEAFGNGLLFREKFAPFDPAHFSATESAGRTPPGGSGARTPPPRPEGQPRSSPRPSQGSQGSTARAAGRSSRSRDQRGDQGDRQCNSGAEEAGANVAASERRSSGKAGKAPVPERPESTGEANEPASSKHKFKEANAPASENRRSGAQPEDRAQGAQSDGRAKESQSSSHG